MMKSEAFKKAESTVEKYAMLSPGDTVLIGLSGGADSVFLTLFFMSVCEKYSLKLKCAHIEHGIRGKDSLADCEFCRSFCEKNGIEFHCLSIDAPAEAAAAKVGVEEYARQRRYAFFATIPCDKIATAHNRSDNAETLIFRLLRGSSLKGAGAIPPKRGKIIRPLIEISGSEIRSCLSQHSVSYRTDKTNFANEYSRNYIRNSVMPLFSKINADYESALARFAECAAADDAYLDSLAESEYERLVCANALSIAPLRECAPPVQGRILAKFLERNGAAVNRYNIKNAQRLLHASSKFQLGAGLWAVSAAGRLRIANIDGKDTKKEFHFRTFVIDYKDFLNKCKLSRKHFDFYCDYDKIAGNVSVRGRSGGDFISPAGRGCTKSLKKLFNEMHIPPEQRPSFGVITDSAGIIGISGICADERVAVCSATEKVFVLELCTED